MAKNTGKNAVPKRPTRDEFELESLGERLSEAKNENSEVVLTVWGRTEQVRGLITEMDPRTKTIHITRYGQVTKVPFLDIWQVDNPVD
ncbi:YolD-like family protein [Paenibacillus sp. HJGM_3]|uniref:YolD-like family protein n=1 Tax=Paenibacillus sp. HJGM_3 TaxID=3379816 RepID=UPI0038595E65